MPVSKSSPSNSFATSGRFECSSWCHFAVDPVQIPQVVIPGYLRLVHHQGRPLVMSFGQGYNSRPQESASWQNYTLGEEYCGAE